MIPDQYKQVVQQLRRAVTADFAFHLKNNPGNELEIILKNDAWSHSRYKKAMRALSTVEEYLRFAD